MSFGGAWFFDDIFDDLLYSDSKIDSFKTLFMGSFIWLIVFPLTLVFSFLGGLFDINEKRKCDGCKKYKLNNVRSPNKFYWFCKDCLKEYHKMENRLLEKLEKRSKR